MFIKKFIKPVGWTAGSDKIVVMVSGIQLTLTGDGMKPVLNLFYHLLPVFLCGQS